MTLRYKIDSLDTVKLPCPRCSGTSVVQVSKYRFTRHETPVRHRCSCGYTSRFVLVKRNLSDHGLNLLGTYAAIDPPKFTGRVTIREINNTGLIFVPGGSGKFTPGKRILLEFVLDDGKQSIVRRTVTVKAAGGGYVSATFCSTDHFDNLGPYLFFTGRNLLEPA